MASETHPVQVRWARDREGSRCVSTKVTLLAYEVYCHLWGEQERLVTGSCRGGFGAGELMALLYARSFPKEEWRARFDEALEGMEGL